jgi:hypothetical protein
MYGCWRSRKLIESAGVEVAVFGSGLDLRDLKVKIGNRSCGCKNSQIVNVDGRKCIQPSGWPSICIRFNLMLVFRTLACSKANIMRSGAD